MTKAAEPTPITTTDSPARPSEHGHLTTQLSAMLAEMVRTVEIPVTGWSPDLQPGGRVGRFRIVRELGRGGFGVVYEAEDGDLGRPVALKVLKPGTRVAVSAEDWMQREARAVASLNHPNIVTLHDFGQGPAGPHLVFELLRGRSLAARIAEGPMPVEEALGIAIGVARALVHAHAAGVVHRDLKPANVHLADDGGAKVLDFGLAHLFGRRAGSGGTPAYMAPEQWTGKGDARSDLFALGVLLFHALTGELPYRSEKAWSEVLEPGETPRLPHGAAPRALRELVQQLLRRSPEARPQTAREVRDRLLAIRRAWLGRHRRRAVTALVAVALAAVGGAGFLFATREAPPGEQVKAVLGAMENTAGKPELDAMPGLLRAALAPSSRVKLVAPARLGEVAREAGLGELGKLDADRGRLVARVAGASLVLVPGAWRTRGGYELRVRAIAAEGERILFSAELPIRDAAELAGAVDRLSDQIRKALAERAEDRRLRRPVAEQVTASAEAARHYYEGVDCLAHRRSGPSASGGCLPFFEGALADDPTFPLAHYQVALIRNVYGSPPDPAKEAVAAAMRGVDRLPRREALVVRALAARIDGKQEEAARLYDAALAEAPEDVEVLVAAADLEMGRSNWGAAVRYLEKVVALAPEQEDPLIDLVDGLGRLDRRKQMGELVKQLEADRTRPGRTKALVSAYAWLGEPARAVALARGAAAGEGLGDLEALVRALAGTGEYAESERVARRLQEKTGGDLTLVVPIVQALAGQGRIRDAIQELERLRPASSSDVLDANSASVAAEVRFLRSVFLAGSGKIEPALREARLASGLGAADAIMAIALLVGGDVAGGERIGAGVPEDGVDREEIAALLAWRRGDCVSARNRLVAVEGREPWPIVGYAPSYLLAEVTSACGDPREALAAVERFHRIPPRGPWRPSAFDRTLLLAARARLALGDRAGARRDLERLLRILARADADLPLLGEARQLRARL